MTRPGVTFELDHCEVKKYDRKLLNLILKCEALINRRTKLNQN